ncbi:ATP-binding cassette domain-containing protein [Baekduia soli]|uniref:ABC-type quaternary amine transporter n=1 Tax=Baekduia soli TaxID=496014 RepID=A0A5B8U7B9_9ACTN|nr:ATP-binding cassette domain-containing protein [Baekduia soli]QEC48984.1 ATP-binding cassette domain-containing protein [Baekduia soli]
MPASSAATLEFRQVSKVYPGSPEPAIRELSLEVAAGELCILIGPSGCGKTTAMRLANRMIELTGGDVLVDGVSVRDRAPAELRRTIGYAIQQIGLFPHLTVAENIGTVPRLLGWESGRIRARVAELLELVGLEADMGGRYPAQLSGGQRQRVGVARALAADPPLLLMDEPFGAIDPITRARLQEEFRRLQRELDKTVVFVTHDIDEALKLGDRIAVLKPGGVLAQFATPDELVRHPADAFVEEFVGADRMIARLEWLTSVRQEGRRT